MVGEAHRVSGRGPHPPRRAQTLAAPAPPQAGQLVALAVPVRGAVKEVGAVDVGDERGAHAADATLLTAEQGSVSHTAHEDHGLRVA